MKRPHRRLHMMAWIVLAPLTLITGIFAWLQRPETPYSALPDTIQKSDVPGD
ncbi:MAG: hypothetical protein AAFW81_05670 [Pseudomonadota bacterium]